ncbi:MAG: type IV pilus secretin PilQ [Gammaproteobacteria bacterium]|nr:type IV pilus secretin PilQ [Gammaproteobacteria bacterium]MYH34952.1 type IV pilus secretin PilQ [Gammaproteobacteria bacterium]MYL00789.1 type IV pilus secretin PilQ [Gammaproteobacteria bacterium]
MTGPYRRAWLALLSLTCAGLSLADEAGRISLSFRELPVSAALQLLAEATEQQMLVSDSVTGTITLEITEMAHDDALALLLETRGLKARRNHGVWVVATPEEFLARDSARREVERAQESLASLQLRQFRVNYASASELAAVIAGGQSTLLSERGTVQVDERTNSLIAHDTPHRLEKLAQLLAKLDLPARQVLIESRVVVANRNYGRNLGLRWGVTAVDRRGEGRAVVLSGTGEATGRIAETLENPKDGQGALTAADVADRYSVSLPVAGAAGRFSLALLHPDYLLDLELAAMQAEGHGRLISAPRVLASDQREASIRQGVEIPYQEAASSGATTTHFKHAALGLTVTPRITPNGRVILRLLVTKDSVGKIVATERGGAVPSIDTRRIETEVLVQDGQTLVLGGIRETENADTQSSVPWLGSIPGLGRLFRSSINSSNETELLVFVTPTIIEPQQ